MHWAFFHSLEARRVQPGKVHFSVQVNSKMSFFFNQAPAQHQHPRRPRKNSPSVRERERNIIIWIQIVRQQVQRPLRM